MTADQIAHNRTAGTPWRPGGARSTIAELIARYFWTVDRRDLAVIGGCFSRAATANLGSDLHGAAAILAHLQEV